MKNNAPVHADCFDRRIVVLLAILLAGQSWADECDQLPKPSITVIRLNERVSINTRYNHKELSHLASTLARPDKQVLGLTRGNAVVKFAISTHLVIDRTRRWECASPQISLTIGYRPLTVYVANEFPEGSCAYKAIYAHELRHVETYLAHLASIEKGLVDTLTRRFGTGQPRRGPVGQTRDQLQRELDQRWLPFVLREINRGDRAQALIDTPEEYARVSNSCGGEIRKYTR